MRGYHHLSCPHCNTVNWDVWVDRARGRAGYCCTACGKWFGVHTQLVTHNPDTMRDQASPLWEAAIKLLSWVPEWKTPVYFAKQDVEQWNMAYYTEDLKVRFLQDAKRDTGAPFVSEFYLYHCLGKEDARTLLSLLRKLLEAGGIEMGEAEAAIWRAKKRAERDTHD